METAIVAIVALFTSLHILEALPKCSAGKNPINTVCTHLQQVLLAQNTALLWMFDKFRRKI